jgi:hypothetical protein
MAKSGDRALVCQPSRWLWGLPPLVLIIALSLFGVRGQLQHDLADRTSSALRDAGYYWALARFDGRDAVLEGLSFSASERDSALNIIKDIWGVRSVTDKTNLIASPETYTWLANKKDQRIKIRGYVPTENDRRTILGFVKAAMPELEVDEKMTLAGGSPKHEVWLGAVSYALVQLGQLKAGSVRLEGTDLFVDGEAASTTAYRTIKTSLEQQLPAGTKVRAVDVAPPVIRPYTWRVKYTGALISFAGYVPSESFHRQILERTRHLFPGIPIDDAMELASGVPDGWLWAVSASLTQLHRLESGRVKLKDTVLEFEGVAGDKHTATNVTASIRHGLPASYRSSEKVVIGEKADAANAKVN